MIAEKQARYRLDDKGKPVYSDNTDKKRVRRPLLTGKADLQVAAFISLLDLRFNAETKEFEICVRVRQLDGDVARSWVKASALDFEDDEENENKLLKLLDLYEHLAMRIRREMPHLVSFYEHKLKLLAVLREELFFMKHREVMEEQAPAPAKKEEMHTEFMKKYGGNINVPHGYQEKKKLFRTFVIEHCQLKLQELDRSLADEYSHIDFSKLISYIRRNFEQRYREKVIQKIRTDSHR